MGGGRLVGCRPVKKTTGMMSLGELKRLHWDGSPTVSHRDLAALHADSRAGVRALAERIEKRKAGRRQEERRLDALQRFERACWEQGFNAVAGVDEVGVGPLAGPVVAGACILPRDFRPVGIDDSKKLDAKRREALEKEIRSNARAWALGEASVEEIDRLNPYHAALLAMRRAVEALAVPADHLLVDARTIPNLAIPQQSIVKGDALSLSIGAASILAKTHRDRLMDALALDYPGYGFGVHKGYGTAEHLATLERLGPCVVHRRSYQPVREAAGLGQMRIGLSGPANLAGRVNDLRQGG